MNGHKRVKEINRSDRYELPIGSWIYGVWVKRGGRKLRAWKLA